MANMQPPSVESSEELDDIDILKKSKSKLWPYLVLIALLGAGAGGYLYKKSLERVPLRVLVAINSDGFWWQGSTVSAHLSDGLAERLQGLGFETVNGGDPKIVDQIERAVSAEEAGKLLKVGFVITGDLTPEVIELPVESKYTEVRVDGELRLAFGDEPLAPAGEVVSWSGAPEKERAIELLSENLADIVFQRALAALMGHEYIQTIAAGENAIARGKLTKAQSYIELRDENVAHAEGEYTRLFEKQAKSEEGGHGIKHHTKFRSDDLLCATGSHGFLVQRSRAEPFYDLEEKTLKYLRGMEELLWVKHDGSEEPVTTAYNLYGYATGHPSGYPVVYVEDLYGWAKAVTVVREDKTTERLRIDSDHRYLDPKISIDKKLVALRDRACAKCPGGLLVLDVNTKKEVFALAGEKGHLGSFGFAGSSELFYTFRPPQVRAEGKMTNPRTEIRKVDFSTSPPTESVFFTFEEGERTSDLSVGEGGKWFVVLARLLDGPAALIFDAKSGEKTVHPAGFSVRGMEASPTKHGIVYEAQGEIFHFDLDEEKETRLTKNTRRDRYPYFSSDGKRIYFEGLADDPNYRRRNVSSIASVKTP